MRESQMQKLRSKANEHMQRGINAAYVMIGVLAIICFLPFIGLVPKIGGIVAVGIVGFIIVLHNFRKQDENQQPYDNERFLQARAARMKIRRNTMDN